MKTIYLEPVPQHGHICKPTAIATIDRHYGKKVGFNPIPLRKGGTHPLSIRELAKRNGSVQGELLEIRQVQKTLEDIGYETELIDFNNNYTLFTETVTKNIEENNLLIGFFAVNPTTEQPTVNFDENEHATIINGVDKDTGELQIVHWGAARKTNLQQFYNSSMALPAERQPEYYVTIKHKDPLKKYELIFDKNDPALLKPGIRKSITPEENSGFRGKLLVVKEPKLEKILAARAQFAPHSNFLTQLIFLNEKIKTWSTEVINHPHKANRLIPAINTAKELHHTLEMGARKFFDGKPTLENKLLFKQTCTNAITKARPELAKHRGWKMLLGNLALAIVGLGIGFVVAGFVNLAVTKGKDFLFFKNTDTSDRLNHLDKAIQRTIRP